ncbi:Pmt5 protein mannosyltransferase (PMT) [Candida orthopsilosis Co 90-125]|uniref:Dolichyl-phosphate-mannose--protein mannosyltransferase n=1 Tax=Candida orthopsilosis (strain 90-125) TaxID=1136231 RepID=H8XAH6_CANO9|nr:Pmt5 protein mannosyltransferase (PMT) [Candida orthopsilosis Co 90-125]CCG24825.1 Pmt5 protein mannosyltransferase (PMT) [Candida orthopsilosis Co 90-125]
MSSKKEEVYRSGPYRPYIIESKRRKANNLTKKDVAVVLCLTSVSLLRIYKIYQPANIVFDEIHILRYVQHYFKGTFFLDVHPPLGRFIYYLLAKLTHFDPDIDFEAIGEPYYNMSYTIMRIFSGICGILAVDVTYLIMRLDSDQWVSLFTAAIVLFENSLATQSRFIFLDSALILGQALSIYYLKLSCKTEPEGGSWWWYLVATGLSLGWTISMKLSGFYTLLWVGVFSLFDMYQLLGDLTISTFKWFRLVFYKLLVLLVLPLTIYLSLWKIHFDLLPFEGPNSGLLSPRLRSTFQDYSTSPVEVLYGSTVTIKHNNLEKYLHSHDKTYPKGSQLQQVTLYSHEDPNNEWVVELPRKFYEHKHYNQIRPVKDGEFIRLYHKATERYLHVSDVRPPISEHDYSKEVNCNETRGLLGNTEYEFKLRILNKKPHATNNLPMIKLRATETVFMLVSRDNRCNLISHQDKLPSWGDYQNEVLCVSESTIPNSLWYIESNQHPLLDGKKPHVEFGSVPFLTKVWDLHQAMFRVNADFTTPHKYSSRPESWPFVLKGVAYFQSLPQYTSLTEHTSQIYFLGNVTTYILSFIVVIIAMVKLAFYTLRNFNPYVTYLDSEAKRKFYANALQHVAGWALHYLPYFFIYRNLYAHHYLPALYFAIMNLGEYLNYQNRYIQISVMIGILSSSIYCFIEFIPLIYGTEWGVASCVAHKWFPGWHMDCMTYGG